MIMRDDAKNVATTEGNHVPMEESNDGGDRRKLLRDPGSASPGRTMSMDENPGAAAGTPALSTLQRLFAGGRAPLIWGVLWGVIQAAAPLGFWWLDAATVYGMSIALIATVYIGFAVADGRPAVIAVETTVAAAFVVIAAAGVTGSAWLIVIGFVGHGLKDLWQHRSHFVANTRWWPPFCMTIDFVAAAIIAVAIVSGVTVHQ
jgi:hypothetical protein